MNILKKMGKILYTNYETGIMGPETYLKLYLFIKNNNIELNITGIIGSMLEYMKSKIRKLNWKPVYNELLKNINSDTHIHYMLKTSLLRLPKNQDYYDIYSTFLSSQYFDFYLIEFNNTNDSSFIKNNIITLFYNSIYQFKPHYNKLYDNPAKALYLFYLIINRYKYDNINIKDEDVITLIKIIIYNHKNNVFIMGLNIDDIYRYIFSRFKPTKNSTYIINELSELFNINEKIYIANIMGDFLDTKGTYFESL